jgi:hypothetical protein
MSDRAAAQSECARPISPIFDSEAALFSWLREHGCSEDKISMLAK